MMSVTQESVKNQHFTCKSEEFAGPKGKFSHIVCNKLPFWRPFCLNSYFIFIFLL